MASAAERTHRSSAQPLEGWKSIADYLGRTVRTVQRWERHEQLPVRRHHHHALATVSASPADLDRWRAERLPTLTAADEDRIAGDTPEVLCAMSREHWAQRTKDSLEKSIDLATAALRRRPDYAPAHAMLAKTYITRASYGHTAPGSDLRRAKQTAQAALRIDPQSVDAHQALAFAHVFANEWRSARRHFDEALRLNPQDATTYQWFSFWLLAQDRDEDALEMSERAEALDPSSLILAAHRSWVLHLIGRHQDAVRKARALIRRNRHFWRGYFNLALPLAALGRAAEAANAMEIATALNNQVNLQAARFHMLALSGDPAAAREALGRLRKSSGYRSPYWIAFAAAAMTDANLVLQQLTIAIRQHEWFVILLKHDHAFTQFRAHPEFQKLIRQIGLP
jgi:tetratricopeptide (TPR) repeat protein